MFSDENLVYVISAAVGIFCSGFVSCLLLTQQRREESLNVVLKLTSKLRLPKFAHTLLRGGSVVLYLYGLLWSAGIYLLLVGLFITAFFYPFILLADWLTGKK